MTMQFSAGSAAVRRREFAPFPGVRSRTRAIPYSGLELPGADPWKASYRTAAEDLEVSAGPDSVDRWAESLAGAPAGGVLVGPVAGCEPVYRSASSAILAVKSSGKGAVVVDALCDPRALPVGGSELVWVAVWRAGDDGLWKRAAAARDNGPSGVALPLIPGWTDEAEFLATFVRLARASGVDFATAFELSLDGASRAAIHSDYSSSFPDRADAYFDELHHRETAARVENGRVGFARRLEDAGIPVRVPMPRGSRDFEANVRACEALEAEADRVGEPSASDLRAAARRIEDFARDLTDLAKHGNGRLLFSSESREWRIIEGALGLAGIPPR